MHFLYCLKIVQEICKCTSSCCYIHKYFSFSVYTYLSTYMSIHLRDCFLKRIFLFAAKKNDLGVPLPNTYRYYHINYTGGQVTPTHKYTENISSSIVCMKYISGFVALRRHYAGIFFRGFLLVL